MKMEQNSEKKKKGWLTTIQPLPLHPYPYLCTSNPTAAPLPVSVYFKPYRSTPARICVLQTLPQHPCPYLCTSNPTAAPLPVSVYFKPYRSTPARICVLQTLPLYPAHMYVTSPLPLYPCSYLLALNPTHIYVA